MKKQKGFTPLKFFKNFFGAKQNNQKTLTGFTLIELLVVIAIIGLLATIVMVSLNTARSKARDARRVSDVRQMQLALQMEYDKAGSYPAALSTLVTDGFISQVPLDPNGTSAYQYCVSTTKGYHLGTKATGLENTGGPLLTDADATDGCTTGSFSGTDPVYDVVP
jgi:prepilin-type N-terminal cleavage/methylation domain-containing protein